MEKKTKKNLRKQEGGFYFGNRGNKDLNRRFKNKTPQNLLLIFLDELLTTENITIDVLGEGEGTYGIIFVIRLNDDYYSSIRDSDLAIRDYNGFPCKRILLKLCYIDSNLKEVKLLL